MGAILEVDCWVPGTVVVIANPFHLVLELFMVPGGQYLFHGISVGIPDNLMPYRIR